MVLHLFNERLVEAKGIRVILVHERLQDEPQTVADVEELCGVRDVLEAGLVGQDGHGEHQHVVWHDERDLALRFLSCGWK